MALQPAPTGRHGAVLLADGQARFALWAPDAESVVLQIEDGASHPMQADADGWCNLLLPCEAGTRYRYLIDGQLAVPDPAARAQDGDVHAASILLDPHSYTWQNPDWFGRPWEETVLYELHVGTAGGYRGAQARLAELAELGITAIELMPLAEFPGERNWGYDGVLPFAPEASYGTPDELKALIDTAHGLGLMVFIDVVYNHFGPDGNYLHAYAQHFFHHEKQTPWGDAIAFDRPEVRDFFIENALMWLCDYRCDGLRLDAVHAIDDDSFLPELASRVRNAVGPDRHVHLVLENEANKASLMEQGFTAQWNDDGHNILHVLLTGERQGYYADYHGDASLKLARFLGEGFVFQGHNTRKGHPRGEPSGHLSPTAFVLFLQNHDQIGNRAFGDRLITLADPEALRAATCVLLLSPMIPLLFMGEEWGSRRPFLYFTSHHGELAEAVREGRRNEFADFAEFADPATRERIPDPNALTTFDDSKPDWTSRREPEHALWLALYRELLAIRHQQIIPRLAGARFLEARVLGDGAASARWALGDGSTLSLALNLGDEPVACELPAITPLYASRDFSAERSQDRLPPRVALVYLEERHV